MNSMTGYGYKEAIVENTQISVEIKSVNNRFLDLNVNIPSFLNPLESKIRKIISEKIIRGKVDVTIRVKDMNSTAKVSADPQAAIMYRRPRFRAWQSSRSGYGSAYLLRDR